MVVDLPAPFGPEEAVHLALAHGEVEAVEGDGVAERLVQPGDGDDVSHVIHATPASEVCEWCKFRVCRPLRRRPAVRRPRRRRSTTRGLHEAVEHLGGALADAGLAAPAGAGVRRADGDAGRPAHLGRARRRCSRSARPGCPAAVRYLTQLRMIRGSASGVRGVTSTSSWMTPGTTC